VELLARALGLPPMDARPVEVVERKGQGHPDSLCDALAEALSLAYSRYCVRRFGAIPHHNVDKALLRAGRSAARFGGGELLEPIEFRLAGRATTRIDDEEVPLGELARDSALAWLRGHLHALDPEQHLRRAAATRRSRSSRRSSTRSSASSCARPAPSCRAPART
jgi:S-adenosylmethionine synthetase